MGQQKQKQKSQNQTPQADQFNWVIQPHKLKKSGLAIGGLKAVENQKLLERQGFGAIVSVYGQSEIKCPPNVKKMRILISDNTRENIKCFFEPSYHFINQHIPSTNVLVHCKVGVSRSATIVIAYLMRKQKLQLSVAQAQVRNQRPIIYPNKGFIKQLKEYQKELKQAEITTGCQLF